MYRVPNMKSTCNEGNDIFTEMEIFFMLDRLKFTSTGLDNLPAWFLRLGAAVFCSQVAALFNLSMRQSIVPCQWKCAIIKPLPKISIPKSLNDFRPISLTLVLTTVMEKMVVRRLIYLALLYATKFAFID